MVGGHPGDSGMALAEDFEPGAHCPLARFLR